MSSEDDYQYSPAQPQPTETAPKSRNRKSRISYTRDFLLSLSELDACKNLPRNFKQSIISEFAEDLLFSKPERQRIAGGLSSQSFRCSEYGSSPPTRGDSNNYSRRSLGRWDSRSSDSNDKDVDSKSEWFSDSGRHYSNQPRRSWQTSEHDGLLGSGAAGAFLRQPGFTATVSAPKFRGNGHHQLCRSNTPYQPPRPYKAVPQFTRNATDLIDDETFGSTECSSQDREEEERKRRDSFELLRKEQQKALQEKLKQVSDNQREIAGTDITALLEGAEDEKQFPIKDNASQASLPPLVLENDSARLFFATQTPAARPLVPPGFTSSTQEKNLGSKVLPPSTAKAGDVGFGDSTEPAEDNLFAKGTFDNHDKKQSWCMDSTNIHDEAKSVEAPLADKSERIVSPSSGEGNGNLAGVSTLCKTSKLSEVSEGQNYGEVTTETDKVTGHKIVNTACQGHSTSVVEKLFGSALKANAAGSSIFVKHHEHDSKGDESWSSVASQSSKFAQWFHEEVSTAQKKPLDDLSCGKPRDLLSLTASSDRGESHVSGVSDEKATDQIPLMFPFESDVLPNRFMTTSATSAPVGISEPMPQHTKSGISPGVITCEDLEQSILQEINRNSSSQQHSVQPWSVINGKAEHTKVDVDDLASQNLLCLLQKGTSNKDPPLLSNVDSAAPDKPNVYGMGNLRPVVGKPTKRNPGNFQDSEKTLTLETLFGTAFMSELHSVDAPVSTNRGATGGVRRTNVAEPYGTGFSVSDGGLFSCMVGDSVSNNSTTDGNHFASKTNDRVQLRLDDPQTNLGSLFSGAIGFEDRADETIEIRLPEEDSLIMVADSVNLQNSKDEPFCSSNTPVNITEKLAALNATPNFERSAMSSFGSPPFLHGHYAPVEPEVPYHNLLGQPSSPQFHHSPMNHGRHVFHSLEAHRPRMNSEIKFMGPENIHQDPAPHRFPANMLRHPQFPHVSAAPTRLDPHHSMLQRMQMPNSLPPRHLIQGLPGGSPPPRHGSNQMASYMSGTNLMQGFPPNFQQPNYNDLGVPMPAGGGGGEINRSEALEQLINMELRSNSRQLHPFAASGNRMGMYDHEFDMGFRYS